jgi:hypothetical protein
MLISNISLKFQKNEVFNEKDAFYRNTAILANSFFFPIFFDDLIAIVISYRMIYKLKESKNFSYESESITPSSKKSEFLEGADFAF